MNSFKNLQTDYKMNKTQGYLFALLILTIVLSSCRSQRAKNKIPIKLLGHDYVTDKMHENESTFDWFSGKAKVDFIDGKKKFPFTAQLRMRKDSAIWISLSTGIGVEGARILLTQDSVHYINRIDKTYFEGDYNLLSSLIDTDIDFNMIQALLTAKDFSWYDYQDLKARVDNQMYQLESTNRHKLKKHSKEGKIEDPVYYQSLWVNPNTFKIERIKIKKLGKENRKIYASYKQYKSVDHHLVPYTMDIDIESDNGMRLEIVYYKINLDQKISFPFSVSKKYVPLKL